jgi:hypothetical protein
MGDLPIVARVIALIAGSVAAVALPVLSTAQTVAGASASYNASIGSSEQLSTTIPGSVTLNGVGTNPIISSSASASVTGGPDPTVSFGSSQGGAGYIGDDGWGPSGQAALTYYLEATSRSGASGMVTLDMSTSASTDAVASGTPLGNAYANSEASLIISSGGNQLVYYFSQSQDCDPIVFDACSGASSVNTFKPMTRLSVLSGASVEVNMYVGGDADIYGSGGGTASASGSVDPYFQIDASTPDASNYSLVFSAGIGNAPQPVPLPASAWLMLSALGGLAMVGRKRSSRVAQFATAR